jgi:hypothetical protein
LSREVQENNKSGEYSSAGVAPDKLEYADI